MDTNATVQIQHSYSPEEEVASHSSDQVGRVSGDASQGSRSSKKRKATWKTSCDLCKARKVKCDRVEPKCGSCASNNRVCIYNERQRSGPKVLEAINRLECLLEALDTRLEEHINDHDDVSHRRQDSVFLSSQSTQITTPSQNGQHTSNSSLAFQDTPGFDVEWSATNEHVALHENMIVQVAAGGPSTWFANSTSAPLIIDSELPPYDLLYNLVDLYFKHVNSWCPILFRKASVDAFFGSQPMDESDRILLHAVVITTLQFSKDPRLTPELRKHFRDVSKYKILWHALDRPSVRGLQALVFLVVNVLGSSDSEQGRNLLALTARNIVQLELHIEKSTYLESTVYPLAPSFQVSQPETWIENEERRRLCWMTFVLDRYATVATADPFMLDETKMDRCLPCRYDLFSQSEPVETRWYRSASSSETIVDNPENLGSFSYHCEVLLILSRIHRFLHEPLDITRLVETQRWRQKHQALDGELNTWLQKLPDEYSNMSQLCHPDPGSRISNWITLHAAFVASLIRLHSPAAYPTVHSLVFAPSNDAIQRCLCAVQSLQGLTQDVLHTGILSLLGHPFAFALWVAARLLIVHAAAKECEVDPKISFFISTLEQMGQHWDVAGYYARILSDVVQEGSSGSGRTFAAMRRSAYELNMITSYRPQTVLEPITTHSPSSSELDYLEVFQFFNYPHNHVISASADPTIRTASDGC